MSVTPHKDEKTGEIIPGAFLISCYPLGRKGKQVRKVVFDTTLAKAKQLELSLRRQYVHAVPHDPKVIDVWPDWVKDYARDHEPSTLKDIEWASLKLLDHFGKWHLSRLTLPLFEQYMDKRRADLWRPPIRNPDPEKKYPTGKPVGKSRINTEIKYMGLFLAYCKLKKYMLALPFDIPKFKRLKKQHKILPSFTEVDQLLFNCHEAARLAVLLYHDSGLRRGEALNLKAEDVLIDDNVMSITGKGNKQRFVIIKTHRLKEALQARITMVPYGYLMTNPKTKAPYKDLRKAIEGAADRAGIGKNIYNHLFRHAHTTRSLEAGEDLEAVRLNQGHEDLSTTQMYLHTKLEHRIKEAKKFQRYLAAKRPKK